MPRCVLPGHSPSAMVKPASPRRHYVSVIWRAVVLTVGCTTVSAVDQVEWFGQGGATPAVQQAIDLLAQAAADGLDASDYRAEWLREAAGSNDSQSSNDERTDRLSAALTAAVRRYLADLHFGRVDPRRLGAGYRRASNGRFDVDALLRSAVAEERLPEAAASVAPRWPQYASLRQALARYRELADDAAWLKSLPALPGGKLGPGEQYTGLALLQHRLELLGDLPPGSATAQRYTAPLVEAVRSFQLRHAETPDGVIGKATFDLLNIPPAARVRQLELALERLRWTPMPEGQRLIVVNLPEFMLDTYEVRGDKVDSKIAMKVIVGTAGKTQTPLFDAEMRFIEFSPYWNVPPSIARGETLPRLRRDPGYFDRQGFEFVAGDGRVINGFSEEGLDAVQRGQLRIRQRPGAGNALGDIKFVFPNQDNIYLHHTPTPQLFRRARRDFSHGCIRVEEPVALARFVLAGEPEWTEERIVQAMRKGKSTTIRLQEELPVIIAYHTAVVRAGRVHFLPDIYALDKPLEQALGKRSQSVQAEASQAGELAAQSPAPR
ncbi:L,D-transpeptidase family protein [Accumulibacter sp.]|uniref:L,D-transpeptidase family protein n=1 Tax=Accumulibacter sp. TaxID=2053492 RepID=UPI0025BADCBA|nr:L,D-transpeptidase family protein [Accumulibacter sp.]